ncbi:flavin monoamine oxidase family protein [Aeromicrobium ginsengisoli]|uniref:FAD-dependent oxidoreductase n=1 Tax=Aeromicrobium ginsengisoli TaxID=363867 RepID=A0A5M4FGF4_9ACTN|nr:FAD-dependent oxidoreductase [Aeromicrobium ginsengisoli]KAA1399217.1 FAD-dependent oxidoreductase [Aeromicrobium ginsengisoli]
MAEHGLSRRGLLSGAAAGGAILAIGGLGEAAEAATTSGSLPTSVDVVVVGGGLSGLVAARKLVASGKKVLVLEARNRVGGRLLNHTLRNGSVIESGGAFVGPTQDHVLALAKELKVETFKEYVTGKNVYVSADGSTMKYTGTVPPDPLILADALLLQLRIDEMSKQVPVDAPWTAKRAAEWDTMTVDTWIRQNTLIPTVREVIKAYFQSAFGVDAEGISLLFLLWYIATAGNETNAGTFERSSGTPDAAQDSRFVGGSGLLPLRVASALGSRVALNAPVRKIKQTSTGVTVVSDRGTVTAKRVIVAIPPPLVLGIDWSPLLPPRRLQLMQRMPMGTLMKVDAVYATPFWRAKGLSGSGVLNSGVVRTVFDNCPADAKVGVLLAFVGGSSWQQCAMLPLAERRQLVLEGFAKVVGAEALNPVEYVEHDWTHERWTMGSPIATVQPGATVAYGSTIREPHGRVHWAGTETATYWSGYMDGAVRAGERAAAEVAKLV